MCRTAYIKNNRHQKQTQKADVKMFIMANMLTGKKTTFSESQQFISKCGKAGVVPTIFEEKYTWF